MNKHKFWIAAVAGLLVMTCSEKVTEYPWITDVSTQVDANGKMVGYEFFAKW